MPSNVPNWLIKTGAIGQIFTALLPGILFLITAVCCTTKNPSEKQPDKPEITEPNNYAIFKKLFEGGSHAIPDSLLLSVLKLDSNLDHNTNYTAVQAIKFSDSVDGFILNFDCGAGGFCNETELVTFKSGQLVATIEIGHDFSDLGGTDSLSYKIEKDKVYLREIYIKEIERDSGDDTRRITEKKSDTLIIDLNNGNIRKSREQH